MPGIRIPIVSSRNSRNSRGGNISIFPRLINFPPQFAPFRSAANFHLLLRGARARLGFSVLRTPRGEENGREFGRAQLSKKSTAISLECNFHAYDTICGGRGYLRKFLYVENSRPRVIEEDNAGGGDRSSGPSLDSFSSSDATDRVLSQRQSRFQKLSLVTVSR